MIKTVLLVIDGQPASHPTIDLSLQWSKEFNAQLVGLGVIDETVVHPAEAVPLGAGHAKAELDAARLRAEQVATKNCLSAIAARCAGEQVAFHPLERLGEPADEMPWRPSATM